MHNHSKPSYTLHSNPSYTLHSNQFYFKYKPPSAEALGGNKAQWSIVHICCQKIFRRTQKWPEWCSWWNIVHIFCNKIFSKLTWDDLILWYVKSLFLRLFSVSIFFASSAAANLKRHLQAHGWQKPNKCNLCDFASLQAGNLRNHLKTHNHTSATNVTLHPHWQADWRNIWISTVVKSQNNATKKLLTK